MSHAKNAEHARRRYNFEMDLAMIRIDLPKEQEQVLRAMARERGMPVEEFARLKLADVASQRGKNFRAAADYVLRKNEELFRRLS